MAGDENTADTESTRRRPGGGAREDFHDLPDIPRNLSVALFIMSDSIDSTDDLQKLAEQLVLHDKTFKVGTFFLTSRTKVQI
jgi:hypothetical protein